MSPNPRFEKFVVIVTYGRSGSTLLQTILQTIPGACIRGENNNALYPLFRSWKRAWNTRYNHGKDAVPPTGPWYGADEIVPRRFGEALTTAFIDQILAPPQGTRVLGFKEIRFHDVEESEFPEFLDFIRAFFAPCHIVFNTRRASDVARSSWWKDMDMAEVMSMIEGLDTIYADYLSSRSTGGFLVRYEDYTKNRDSLRTLFTFLDEPFDAKRIESVGARQLPH